MPSPTKSQRRPGVIPAASELPLPTLLSQVLVAFTIELDNEFEHRTPHWTTNHTPAGLRQGLWLGSMVMWFNCMRWVGEQGVRVSELADLARTPTNLNGMERWGYVTVSPGPGDTRPKPPRSGWLIRATSKGRQAQEVWKPLFATIEERWRSRFGTDHIAQLRGSLSGLIARIDLALPDCLPILGYGLFSRGPDRDPKRAGKGVRESHAPAAREDDPLHLPSLLSRVLLAFAIEFERGWALSLAISANVVRVLDEKGVQVRDLPLLTGVSKEAISVAMGFLEKRRFVAIEPESPGSRVRGSRVKVARLTAQGLLAREAYCQRLVKIEEDWQSRFGKDTIRTLRKLLENLVGEPGLVSEPKQSPLHRGLEPYPDGWRAGVSRPNTLPHYPMVLHRGGFPDGS